MSQNVSISDAARHIDEYVERVVARGERFVLLREGEAVAELGPVVRGKPLGELVEFFESLPHLTPEEADSFAEDLSRIRSEGALFPLPRDPWAS